MFAAKVETSPKIAVEGAARSNVACFISGILLAVGLAVVCILWLTYATYLQELECTADLLTVLLERLVGVFNGLAEAC